MRLAVSGNGYSTATTTFLEANYLTATLNRQLTAALAHTGGMAGHTAAGFAASYDQAARQGIGTLVDLTDALANLGRMSQATARNHAHAEALAVIGHTVVYDDPQPEPTYAHLTAQALPTAAGSHRPTLPHWEAWLLDHIEGFVWPDSDTDRLRDAAHAWRTASHQLHDVKTQCLHAATALESEVAPDIQLAADATRRLATHADSLAQDLHGLARSCDDLADQVEHHRDQVLDLVRDTLRDAMIVEGIGIVLGAVSGGITAAAASSANAARIAAIAPRILRIIEALRIAIGASQTGARVAAAGVVEARTAIQAFVKARIIAARSDRGCVTLPWLLKSPKIFSVEEAERWMARHELAGGHAVIKHVARSDQWLFDRIARDGLRRASSFGDIRTAATAINATIHEHSAEIAAWLENGGDMERFEHEFESTVGRLASKDGTARDANIVRVVLARHPSNPSEYFVYTAYLL